MEKEFELASTLYYKKEKRKKEVVPHERYNFQNDFVFLE